MNYDRRWFLQWEAVGTLINGSNSTSETFFVGNPAAIKPKKVYYVGLKVGEHVAWEASGPLAEAAYADDPDYNGNILLHAPLGTIFKLSPTSGAPENSNGWWDYPGGSGSKWLAWGRSICVIPPYAGVVKPMDYILRPALWSQCYSGDSGVKVSGGMAYPFYIPGSIRTPVEWECCYGDGFRLRTEPAIGFQVASATINGEVQCIGGLQDIPFEEDRPLSISVRSVKQSMLAVFCKTYPEQLAGGSFYAYMKIGSEWVEMGKYAGRVTVCHPYTELINLTAQPQLGFIFSHWTGDAQLFNDDGSACGTSLSDDNTDPGQWARDPTIYLKCHSGTTNVVAHFEREPEIISVDFTSDDDTLSDENVLFAPEGNVFPAPVWWPAEQRNYPITHTKAISLTAMVRLRVPSGWHFTLEGTPSLGLSYMKLQSEEQESTGDEQDVDVESNDVMPNYFCHVDPWITWKIHIEETAQEMPVPNNMSRNGIYVLWGTPQDPTIRRLNYLLPLVDGKGPGQAGEIGAAIADALSHDTGFPGTGMCTPLWLALDDPVQYPIDCDIGQVLARTCLGVLGWRQSDSEPIVAYPSTDECSCGYTSDCSQSETRDGKTLHFRYDNDTTNEEGWYPAENGFRLREQLV